MPFKTVVLEKTSESPLDSKEIKSNLKGDQPWIFTGRTDAEAPVFWSSNAQSWLTGKVLDAGTDWAQKEKRVSEDDMAGWHYCWPHAVDAPKAGTALATSIAVVLHSPSHVQLFLTPWTAACQASLSLTISWSLPKFTFIASLRLSSHLILCHPLLLPHSIFPSIRVFSKESVLPIRWPKYCSFNISPSNKFSGLSSFSIDWFDLLAVQRTLKRHL